jgi:hypothetical protein
MSRATDIAAVVVSHQSAATLEECLRRLRAARDVAAIRVVDNASTDGTLAIAQRHALQDARVRFVANPDNPGFAVGCNQGVGRSARTRRRGWRSSIRIVWSSRTRWRAFAITRGRWTARWSAPIWSTRPACATKPRAGAIPSSARCCVRRAGCGWACRWTTRARCSAWMRCPAR